MSEKDTVSSIAQAAAAIVPVAKVYEDTLQPAAKEVGTALQTVTKLVHVALAPVSATVWGYERIRDYIVAALSERLKHTPTERIVSPSPMLAGPAIESLRFAANEPTLREMYANLLASAMDAETARHAHPAFVEILKQITPDEARVLRVLAIEPMQPLVSVRAQRESSDGGYREVLKNFSLVGEDAQCVHGDLVSAYLDNLCRLKLIDIPWDARLNDASAYEIVEQHPTVVAAKAAIAATDGQRAEVAHKLAYVTVLGRQFIDACVVGAKHA